jgi:hypothetical protein
MKIDRDVPVEPVEPTRLQRLLARAVGTNDIAQVHEVRLREVDAYAEDEHPVVVLIPIGNVIGVAIVPNHQPVKDSDIVFVSASAFGNALPALGFTVRGPVSYVVPPAMGTPDSPEFTEAVRRVIAQDLAIRPPKETPSEQG